jgi:hypothetical protein
VTVYVLRNNVFVVKRKVRPEIPHDFPLPMIRRFEPYESPVTGEMITSERQRARDMAAVGACDPRDLPRAPFEQREQENARQQQRDRTASDTFEWGGPTGPRDPG